MDSYFDFSVFFEETFGIFGHRLELYYGKRLQFFFQRRSQRPSPVNIPRCEAVRPWRVVDDELDHVQRATDIRVRSREWRGVPRRLTFRREQIGVPARVGLPQGARCAARDVL